MGTNSVAGTWGIGFYQYDPADATPSNSPTTNIILDSVYTPPSTPTLSSCPSATKLDVGQSVSCTASFTGGTSPYTYNWLVVNSITDAVVANMLYTGVTTTSNTFTYTTQSVDTANSPLAFNVIVTDAHPTTVNSVYSSTFAVNTVPSISISPSSATIDNGQSITLTASTSGGTLPISYAWYSGSTCSGTVLSTSASYSPSPSSTTTYCAEATDSATTAETSTSTVTVTVNSALGTPTLSPSTTQTLDNGQSVSFSTSWSGGTSSYTAYLYSSSTSSCSTSSTLVQTVSSATSPTSFTAQSPSSTLYYCSAIKDSASTPETTTSSATEVKVNSALGTPSISPTTANKYDYGQAIPFSSTWSGGTSTYTTNWIVVNSITGTQLANALYSGISSTSNSFSWAFPSADAGNTVQANVLITDSATTPESTNSVKSATLTLNKALSPTISISNTILDVGQYQTLTATSGGGTSPYTYNFLVVNSVTTGTIAHNALYTNVASTSNTFTFQTVSADTANSEEEANVIITDSAATPATANSIYSTKFTINPALTTPSISQTATSLDVGQSVTLTTSWSGGSPDYTVKWYSGTSSTCSSDTTLLATYSSLTGTSNSITESPTSTTYYCIFVTDSATTPETTNSINSEVVVNSALGTPTLSSSPNLPSTQATGNTITFTSSWSGGTPDYTANYLIVNTITGNLVANMLFKGITGTTNSFAWTIPSADAGNTVQANVIITDSATTPETTNSVKSGTLTIKNTDLATLQITWFNSSVTTLTSQETQNQTLHTGSSFSIATWTNVTGLAGNFFLFRINNTEKYYLNGTLLQGNALVANYSSQILVNKQYCLPQGEYWIEWNETGNQLYLPFDVNAIIYEGTNQQGCQSHSGGGTPTQQIIQTTTIRQPLSIAVNQTSILPTFPSIALECKGQMQGEQIILGLFGCTIFNLPVIIILLGAVVLILAVREQKKRMRK